MPYVERNLFILMSRQLALPELKRYLFHCAQPYRTPKNCTRRAAVLKRHGDVPESKATRGRVAIQNIPKRHGDVPHSEIFQSGARRTALQKGEVNRTTIKY